MNLLVVGASHRTAPVSMLERLSIPSARTVELATELLAGRYVAETVVLSTCNRTEVYAAVDSFHGGLTQIAELLARHAGVAVDELSGHLYVRHEGDAIRHAFAVASGLDSLVAGEAQILGQFRDAYDLARDHGFAARTLHELMQTALRVGKRVHNEAHVDAAAPSVVAAVLDRATELAETDVDGASALVIGAGSMGALASSALRRRGVATLHVANRDIERAKRLAANYDARVWRLDELAAVLPEVDVIVTATGAPAPILDAATLAARRSRLIVCDVAVPRDVASDVEGLAGVTLVDIAALSASGGLAAGGGYLEAAERILAEETDAFRTVALSAQVAPTVAALRTRADEVVDAELSRLTRRTPELTDDQRAEVAHTVHRVVRQLLHQPTVRVRQLAAEPGGESYTRMVRELFALDSPVLQSVDGGDVADCLRVSPTTSDTNDM
ncbi:glutamyl-tRNA reductase [Stackebrandtia soli]|uniref:glutamyl-tRNA reductase n=1 Tax=Stackebrandtia soli TaxID=1892856 RepID=UPI0039E845D9